MNIIYLSENDVFLRQGTAQLKGTSLSSTSTAFVHSKLNTEYSIIYWQLCQSIVLYVEYAVLPQATPMQFQDGRLWCQASNAEIPFWEAKEAGICHLL